MDAFQFVGLHLLHPEEVFEGSCFDRLTVEKI